jgi:cytochrome c-type biogenesis protein CcmH/NrfF
MGYMVRSASSICATGKRGRPPAHRRASRFRGIVAIAFFALLVLDASGAAAKSWSYDLAGELMSPYCPGRTLSSCPSPQAAELVQWMVVQEAAGVTREEVVEILIERFGEEILGAPPAKGVWLWAYGFLILTIVIGGGLVVVVVLRRIVARSGGAGDVSTQGGEPGLAVQSAGVTAPAGDDDDLARLVDADLSARG